MGGCEAGILRSKTRGVLTTAIQHPCNVQYDNEAVFNFRSINPKRGAGSPDNLWLLTLPAESAFWRRESEAPAQLKCQSDRGGGTAGDSTEKGGLPSAVCTQASAAIKYRNIFPPRSLTGLVFYLFFTLVCLEGIAFA